MLGIGPGVPVQVVGQQLGVSTSVQLTPQGGTVPYQLGDLTQDPNTVGTQDILSGLVHQGNQSWYIGDSTNVTHVVDVTNPPGPNSPFQLGLEFHIDAYNPTASVVSLFQHFSTDYLPGLGTQAGQPTRVTCAVGFGCH